MRRGLKYVAMVRRSSRMSSRSEDSPMRRGLKSQTAAAHKAQLLAIRRFPDEEGTEMRILVGRVRHVHRRSEDSPMRRGLKCLEAATARGQNAENDQKIPR